MNTSLRRFARALLAALAVAHGSVQALDDPSRWQAMAREDLDAAHRTILEAHPGMVDADNPTFAAWAEDGYHAALALIPHVVSYDTALAAVRFYTVGFEDAHLAYSDDIRADFPIWVTGWMVRPDGDRYAVSTTIGNGPGLPAVGATWTGCDAQPAAEVLRIRVAPFVDRRGVGTANERLANWLWLKRPVDGHGDLRECDFVLPDGSRARLPVTYRAVTTEQFFDALVASRAQAPELRPGNGFDVIDGVLWVRARDFQLSGGAPDRAALDAMLGRLRAVRDARAIVFDVRGNGGGDSGIGDDIFEAATGGLEFDRTGLDALPRYHAQWRVSNYLIGYLRRSLDRTRATYGAESARVAEDTGFLERVVAARKAGETWVDQDAGPRLTQADVAARRGHLRRFEGPIALLTDERCVSACLDFADVVLQVPGALHLGRTTDADSVYMVASMSRMPSRNKLVVPVKVWRNRVRGNNEPLVPAVPIDLRRDERAIRSEVLRALRPAAIRRRAPASSVVPTPRTAMRGAAIRDDEA